MYDLRISNRAKKDLKRLDKTVIHARAVLTPLRRRAESEMESSQKGRKGPPTAKRCALVSAP